LAIVDEGLTNSSLLKFSAEETASIFAKLKELRFSVTSLVEAAHALAVFEANNKVLDEEGTNFTHDLSLYVYSFWSC
jgi:hypothetical protein